MPRMSKERADFLAKHEADVLKQSPCLRPLRDRLLALGGRWVLLAVIEEDLANLLSRGEIRSGPPVMRRGEPCRCHKNASDLWDAHRRKLEIMTGYALSKDGIWRQHSWCWWTARGEVVETTDPRVVYYGYRMTPAEAEQFWIDTAI